MADRKYSVFISNVTGCSDRYCSAYSKQHSISEMFDRVKSIPELSAVDIVLTSQFLNGIEEVKNNIKRTGLQVASVAVDTFANPVYGKGSLSSVCKEVRTRAIKDAFFAVDFAKEVGCNLVTIWPGQDGYDYIFQSDYMKERMLFQEALKEICAYAAPIQITLEYKQKEPRIHSYISNIGTTLLMIQEMNMENLGVALDFGHSLLGQESPAEAVAMCSMYGDRLRHVHINDNYRLWDDDMIVGSVHTLEYLEFIYWLKRTNYQGYITFDQFPYREDGRDAIRESVLWLSWMEEIIQQADFKEIEMVIGSQDGIAASRLMRKLLKGKEV